MTGNEGLYLVLGWCIGVITVGVAMVVASVIYGKGRKK